MGHRPEEQRSQAGRPSQRTRPERDPGALKHLPHTIARQTPEHSPGLRAHPTGDDQEQPVRFYLYSDAFAELVFAAEQSNTAFAVLRGNFGIDDDGGFVEITGFSEFTELDPEQPAYPRVRKACDEIILSAAGITVPEVAVMLETAPTEESGAIVGLFVCERGQHARLDEGMAMLHYSLFNVPFQSVVVFDPEHRLLALYARPPRGRFENLAFRWVTPAQSA